MSADFDAIAVAAVTAFGEAVTYAPPSGGGPYSLNAVVDGPWLDVEFGADAPPANAVYPSVTLRVADLPAAPLQGGQIIARGKTYAVREVRVDGQGMMQLILNYLSG